MSSPTDSSIPVTVNGDGRTVPEDYPLTELLRHLEIDPDNEDEAAGVAVALNESVVRRQDWEDVRLAEEDSIEIIQAQPGG
ncbi:sulfur carrier protein [Salinibacter ruber]|uniref:sulfur carrier protein ThiS n=1 Tax=Salinibacter ruber TaxID=146919 RepID=UPI00216904D4|nr:sulfur carrier protein ThiS [Salinibacter ruber]MCS3667070.1 sulfur carrier protein [Salinibacter ruber]